MVLRKGFSEMVNSVLRTGKCRYILIAVLIINVLLINQVFFDNMLLGTNPFKSSAPTVTGDEPWTLVDMSPMAGEQSASLAAPAPPNSTAVTPKPKPKPKPKPYVPTNPMDLIDLGPPKIRPLLSTHDYDFNGPYVGWPLERVCQESAHTPGLVFVCDNNSGGIGNIRNFILTCIRYAIEAGASGIILPRIQRRSEKDLAQLTTGYQPFSYFFDEIHFRYVISHYCPHLEVYDNIADVPHAESMLQIKDFYPKDLNPALERVDERGVNQHIDMFRTKFNAWLLKGNHTPSEMRPVTIRFKWAVFFEWPVYRDGPEFATTFGDILRIRSDIQALAAATIKELSAFVGVPPNPNTLDAPYLGVHLRTEMDALNFWPNFNVQSDGYLEQAAIWQLKYAYLACGNNTEAQRFADKAWHQSQINVTTKYDLLHGQALDALKALTWDQQALVDFLVLQKSTHFVGCSFSSFSMNVAFKRHSMIDGIFTRPWRSPGDMLSTLIGRFEKWWGDWMFMYDCMWP